MFRLNSHLHGSDMRARMVTALCRPSLIMMAKE